MDIELWTSDGTTATFIKNIATGDVPAIPIFNDGNPENFIAFNGEVYFLANAVCRTAASFGRPMEPNLAR